MSVSVMVHRKLRACTFLRTRKLSPVSYTLIDRVCWNAAAAEGKHHVSCYRSFLCVEN